VQQQNTSAASRRFLQDDALAESDRPMTAGRENVDVGYSAECVINSSIGMIASGAT